MTSGPRILIVLFGAIGDVTRALPLLCRLRRGMPGAHLAWAVEPLAAPLLEGHPALDERLVFRRERGSPSLAAFASLLRAVRAGHFDLVLDLGRQLKSGIVAAATRAPRRIGFHRRNAREGNWLFQTETIASQEHFTSKLGQYLRFADHLGVAAAPVRFGLLPTAAERTRAQRLLEGVQRPFAAFILGSSCPSRRWFPERTAAAARALRARYGCEPVLLGAPADRRFADVTLRAVGEPARNLAGATTLRELVAVLAEARVAVGPDSGPMHLAAAVGTPVVSLWGPTSAARSAPWGSEAHTVIGSAPCAPCYLTHCPIGRACMAEIHPEQVVAAVEAAWQAPRGASA
jgi:lipopolysaccharide heptosyltransferase II